MVIIKKGMSGNIITLRNTVPRRMYIKDGRYFGLLQCVKPVSGPG